MEYALYKKVKGDEQATLYETALTLRHFERLIGSCGLIKFSFSHQYIFGHQQANDLIRITPTKKLR